MKTTYTGTLKTICDGSQVYEQPYALHVGMYKDSESMGRRFWLQVFKTEENGDECFFMSAPLFSNNRDCDWMNADCVEDWENLDELTGEQLTELFAIQRHLLHRNVFVSNEVMSELILDEHNFVINTEAN
tara:strand:- start:72 stop:461 length:390 start_codon:yes stop_codon:yes gene_type:complete